jgi:hypothetical protein
MQWNMSSSTISAFALSARKTTKNADGFGLCLIEYQATNNYGRTEVLPLCTPNLGAVDGGELSAS